MVNVVPCEKAHLDLIDLRTRESEDITREILENVVESSVAVSVITEGRVVAILGYFEQWAGVYEVFLVPSTYLKTYAKSVLPLIKMYLDRLFKEHGAHRLQSSAHDDLQTDVFMEYIGFECEGVLRKYSANKQDYKMWARLE